MSVLPCAGKTDTFMVDDTAKGVTAKAICATCPITARCLERELEVMRAGGMTFGVYGNTTAIERRAILRAEQHALTPRPTPTLAEGHRAEQKRLLQRHRRALAAIPAESRAWLSAWRAAAIAESHRLRALWRTEDQRMELAS